METLFAQEWQGLEIDYALGSFTKATLVTLAMKLGSTEVICE